MLCWRAWGRGRLLLKLNSLTDRNRATRWGSLGTHTPSPVLTVRPHLNHWKFLLFWGTAVINSFWISPEAFVFIIMGFVSGLWLSFHPSVFPLSFSSWGVCLCLIHPFQQCSLFSSLFTWGKVYSALGPTEAPTSIKQIDGRFNTFPNYCL